MIHYRGVMSDDKNQPFTAERLGEAFHDLGQLAYEAGRVIDCLMLAWNFRASTADVDAVAAEEWVRSSAGKA